MMLEIALGEISGLVVILLLLRPLVLWYFKINRRTKALESIDQSLKCLPAVQNSQASKTSPKRSAA